MSIYIQLSTQALTDAKLLAAGPEAGWLWLKGLLYAKEHLTDGFVPQAAIPLLGIGLDQAKSIEVLLNTGLWTRAEGGYTVGTERWARWQTSKEQVEVARQKNRDRQKKYRDRNAVTHDSVTPMSHVTSHATNDAVTQPKHKAQSTEYIQEHTPPSRDAREEPPLPEQAPPSFAEVEAAGYPEGMPVLAMVSEIFARTALTQPFPVCNLAGAAIAGIARSEKLSLHAAADVLERRIRDALCRGSTVNRFWFEDGKWKANVAVEGERGSAQGNPAAGRVARGIAALDQAAARFGVGADRADPPDDEALPAPGHERGG